MIKGIVRRAVMAAVVIGAGAGVFMASSQAQEETMEQKYKNIQVLKGLPASQMRPMMNYISAALGVECIACHVKNGDEWEFDKDDKRNKQTTRKMIQMTMDLNKNSFEGKMEVTCYTCHQGLAHPASVPPLPRAAAPEAARAGGPWPTPNKVLDKYIAAIGGKEALEKIKTRQIKGVSVAANGQSFPLEIVYGGSDRLALTVSLPNGETSQKLNGSEGWLKSARDDRAMDSIELNKIRSLASSLDPLPFREPYPRMAFGGTEKINGRDTLILRQNLPDKRRARYFFDAETGLLVRRIIQAETIIGIDPELTDYEDYREVDGVKMPFTIKTSYLDRFYSSTRKFSEVRNNATIDETKFALPAKK